MANVPPSTDPSNLDSLTGAYREIFNKLIQNTDGMLPAKVVAYQAGPPSLVQVQPMVAVVTTTNTTISRAQLASIPVLQLGGGGFVMSFPLRPGDLGWILANDRDISLYLQSLKESRPNTFRKKSFSDAIFIPGVLSGYTLADGDAANLVIQSVDGATKLSISPTEINISASESVTITTPVANIDADTVNLAGESGEGVARIGDLVDSGTFRIIEGSTKVFAN